MNVPAVMNVIIEKNSPVLNTHNSFLHNEK